MKKNTQEADSAAPKDFSRRELFQGAAVLAAGTAASALVPASLAAAGEPQASSAPFVAPRIQVAASPGKNIVETDSGKVFGYAQDGVIAFRGIPYGGSTAGKNRFMPPTRPTPWAGVRSALYWGPVAPQPFTATLDGRRAGWTHDDEAFMFQWEDGHDSEDCLRINVWTPSINDNRKRPVMVWLHGGGFVAGSSYELRMYAGDGLVRRGDVVVVSVNHRLGVLGYANLMEHGDQYASSPNVGMLDLVAALEWVKTNISNFGGDPDNVLIFGQSGGGAKVSTLMGMPSAKGLFHRGVVESGSSLTQATTDASAKTMAGVLKELGLTAATISRIHELPYQQIVEATLHAQSGGGGGIGGWGPVVDGRILPRNAWDPDAPSYSANVPLIVGTVLNEFFNSVQMEDPSVDAMTMADARKRLSAGGTGLRAGIGKGADHVIEVFQKAYPNATPFEVYSRLMAMRSMRLNAHDPGGAQGRPGHGTRVQLLVPVADAGARRPRPRVPLLGAAVRLLPDGEVRVDDRRRAGRAGARRPHGRRVDQLRADRRSESRGTAALAGLWHGDDADDDLRQHVRREERSRRRHPEGPRRGDRVGGRGAW